MLSHLSCHSSNDHFKMNNIWLSIFHTYVLFFAQEISSLDDFVSQMLIQPPKPDTTSLNMTYRKHDLFLKKGQKRQFESCLRFINSNLRFNLNVYTDAVSMDDIGNMRRKMKKSESRKQRERKTYIDVKSTRSQINHF